MNIYYYIALSNPDACFNFCNTYGYVNAPINSIEELATCCQEVVAAEGEDAFRDLLKLHPDKGVIIESFSGKSVMLGYDGNMSAPMPYQPPYKKDCDCNCDKKNINADGGNTNVSSGATSQQTGLFIVAAALLLSVAIITRK